jgi:UDP-2-acetamido-3-amino-2,3-dideoxy-glucuronate N-acetyltransferase
MVGNPAKQMGWMSEFGEKLKFDSEGTATCEATGDQYELDNNQVRKLTK